MEYSKYLPASVETTVILTALASPQKVDPKKQKKKN
jgi:hypothetical protein